MEKSGRTFSISAAELLTRVSAKKIKRTKPKIINVKRVRVYLDDSAKTDFERFKITPEDVLKKIIYIYQKENSLDFSYDLRNLTVRRWRHKKPPRQFWGKKYICPLHDFLFMEAEKNIGNSYKEVIFVFSGDLGASSGITRLGWDGTGIIVIGTKDIIINPIDALMGLVKFRYVVKKIFNIIRFLSAYPDFLKKSKRNRYLLALAAAGAHEQAHAFGIRHT